MRRIPLVFALVLVATPSAFAQSQPLPRFDLNFSVGAFTAQEDPAHDDPYGDDWYSEGRYAVGFGYRWTERFRTEVEFATTGEGSHYIQEFTRVPGTPYVQPISVESFHRIQQTAVRGVWDFLPNSWVQPYVNIGGVFQADRQRLHSPEQFYYPSDPRNPSAPIRVRPEMNSATTWDYRGGWTAGAGSKFYVSTNSYINGGMQITHTKPTTTVAFLAGFGIEF